MLAMVSNDELNALNQIMVKQLKNRYSDPNMHKRFVIGVDRSKMKLFDVEDAEHDLINDVASGKKIPEEDVPLFDLTNTGKKINAEGFQFT